MKNNRSLLSALTIAVIFLFMAYASTPAKPVANTKYSAHFSYTPEKDEVVKNKSKLAFLKSIPNPSIVLRVPQASQEVLNEDKNVKTDKNYDGTNNLNDINVYNVIEKELLKGGFTVRDRALFAKVLNDKVVNDYSKIKELTETDLILELSSIQFVKYPMNSFTYNVSGKKGVQTTKTNTCPNNFNLYGLKLEFRLIKVKDNEFIGSFTYNYTPCAFKDCNYNIEVSETGNNFCYDPYIYQGVNMLSKWNLIPQSDVEEFVKISSQKMVNEIISSY